MEVLILIFTENDHTDILCLVYKRANEKSRNLFLMNQKTFEKREPFRRYVVYVIKANEDLRVTQLVFNFLSFRYVIYKIEFNSTGFVVFLNFLSSACNFFIPDWNYLNHCRFQLNC